MGAVRNVFFECIIIINSLHFYQLLLLLAFFFITCDVHIVRLGLAIKSIDTATN
jgi:hypothetical protein